jgi:hypothetical protein
MTSGELFHFAVSVPRSSGVEFLQRPLDLRLGALGPQLLFRLRCTLIRNRLALSV